MAVDNYLTKYQGPKKVTCIRINALKFRHTFAVRCLLDGVPEDLLQKLLAHTSLIVTWVNPDVLSMDTSIFMKHVRLNIFQFEIMW
jgi:integrase